MTTTTMSRLSLVAQRQQRRAIGDIVASLLFLSAAAATLALLLSF